MDHNEIQLNEESNKNHSIIFKLSLFKIVFITIPFPILVLYQPFQDFILSNKVLTLVTYLGYLILVFITGLIKDVAKVAWKEMKPKIVSNLVDYIEKSIKLSFSKFYKRYKTRLVAFNQLYTVQGMAFQSPFSPELKKVFIELDILDFKKQRILSQKVTDEKTKRNIWSLLENKSAGFRTLVILGKPNSGKTTLLQHLVLLIASKKAPGRIKYSIPILLPLRKFVDDIVYPDFQTPTLADLLQNDFAEFKPPSGWFEHQLGKNGHRCLVMLDGLDEVTHPEEREKIVKWVEKQTKDYANARFILTSRPHGYHENRIYDAAVLELADFSRPQIFEFVQKWYREMEIASSTRPKEELLLLAKRNATDLLQRIFRSDILSKLAINPLLLSMITMVHRFIGELPERRAALYADICKVLLTRRKQTEIENIKLGINQKQSVLQALALAMMTESKRELLLKDAREIIIPILELVNIHKENAELFLKTMMDETGLLIEPEYGKIAFCNLIFQEYLAAAEIKNEEILVYRVGDTWWHETILFYSARADATNILKKCFEPPRTLEKLKLAYEISQEAMHIALEERRKLENEILTELESKEAYRRQLALDLILEIRLKKMIRLRDDLEIDPFFISQAEYQNFIDETGLKPDHWLGFQFYPGKSLIPITGIRHSDAAEYAKWLTNKAHELGHVHSYFRLLTKEEISLVGVQENEEDQNFIKLANKQLGTWIKDGKLFSHGKKKYLNDSLSSILNLELMEVIKNFEGSNPMFSYQVEILRKDIDKFYQQIEIAENTLRYENLEYALPKLPVIVDQLLEILADIKKGFYKFEAMAKSMSYSLNFDRGIMKNLESMVIDLSRSRFSRSENGDYQSQSFREINKVLFSIKNEFNFFKSSFLNYEMELSRLRNKLINELEIHFNNIINEPIDIEVFLDFLTKIKGLKLSKEYIDLILTRRSGRDFVKARHELVAFGEYFLLNKQEEEFKKTIRAFWALYLLELRSRRENPLPAFEGIRLAHEIRKSGDILREA